MRKISRPLVLLAAFLGSVLVGFGIAYAAVNVFGFGTMHVEPGAPQSLQVTDTQLLQTGSSANPPAASLAPGRTNNIRFIVKNTSDVPVTINALIIRSEDFQRLGGGNCGQTGIITPLGDYADHSSLGPGIGNGWKTAVTPGRLQPGEVVPFIATDAIGEDNTGTELCGYDAKLVAVGTAG